MSAASGKIVLPELVNLIPLDPTTSDLPVTFYFSSIAIPQSHVFYVTPLSVAFTNIKPIFPHHVLVTPRRVVPRFKDLSPEEVTDIWRVAQKISSELQSAFHTDGCNLAIQDGPSAGQSIPHVHIHILPRKENDIKRNDDVYDAMSEQNLSAAFAGEKDTPQATSSSADPMDPINRKARTDEEQAQEARQLRSIFCTPTSASL